MVNTGTNGNEKETKFENIKQLNAMNAQGGEVSRLLQDVGDLKRKVDTLLNAQKEKERALRERQKAEQEALKPKEAPKEEKPLAPAPEVEKHELPKAPAPEAAQPAPPASKPEVKPPVETVTRTRSFAADPVSKTPSYIKGRVALPTPTPRTPQNARPPRPQNGQRPFTPGARPFTPGARPAMPKIELPTAGKDRKSFDKRKDVKKPDDKKSMSKRTLIRKGFIPQDMDEERMGTRKLKNKRVKEQPVFAPIKIDKAVITTENLTVKILSEKIGKTAQEIIKQLMTLGIMTTINSVVDFPTMELVANELGVELELKLEQTKEELLEAIHEEADDEKDLVKRPPIITVMGHVDHGKTSLLDAIRNTTVAAGEAGGITQHIGAYSVTVKGEKITFLDTPGHEAFTQMRARGAQVTDIAVLIVAADDGVMPQTVEAINHAKAANVPILVAINKIDKPGANPEKIKQALTEYELVASEWGGDTMMVPISAKNGEGIDKLLENILFLAEYNGYKANPKRQAKCSVIEAKLDKGKGPVANLIVLNGTLHVGDYVVSGVTGGRVRAMADDKGRAIKEAGPSTPISILGFDEVPGAGDSVFAVSDEKMARQVISERQAKIQSEKANEVHTTSFDDALRKLNLSKMTELNLVVKADVQGSVEALKNALTGLSDDNVRVNVVHGGVGAINRSDLMLAEVSKAIIVGFNVRPDTESKSMAEANGVDIRLYKIIYEATEDIERVMKGLVEPTYREVVLGRAQVRSVFKITGAGTVAGSYVLNGKIQRNAKCRVYRDGEVIHTGTITGLKHFKEDVKEMATGFECGINLGDFNDVKENDEIEAYLLEEEK